MELGRDFFKIVSLMLAIFGLAKFGDNLPGKQKEKHFNDQGATSSLTHPDSTIKITIPVRLKKIINSHTISFSQIGNLSYETLNEDLRKDLELNGPYSIKVEDASKWIGKAEFKDITVENTHEFVALLEEATDKRAYAHAYEKLDAVIRSGAKTSTQETKWQKTVRDQATDATKGRY